MGLLFENRKVEIQAGTIEEPLNAFGTRAYAIPVGPLPAEDLTVDENNLRINPSWEYQPSVGIPSGCYANMGDGATAFVDSRVARHGRHSLRLMAPTEDQTPSLGNFPMRIEKNREYRVSIWGQAKTPGVQLEVSLGSLGQEQFALTTDWQEYSFTCSSGETEGRVSAGVGLKSAGTAWIDLFQVVPVEATD